ncbi:LIM domain-containing protein [Dionaea muscipula]
MAFTGTLDKCKACDKTVYFVDLLSADGITYHKYCFKCSHCKGTLVMSNYSSMDGVLYCKPHFEQLFKESGNFSKNFQAAGKEKHALEDSKQSFFHVLWNTRQMCNLWQDCIPNREGNSRGECYHKPCFKCAVGGCSLTHSSYAALDGVLYCKHHFGQLFMEKGNYSHILQAAKNKKTTSGGDSEEHEDTTEHGGPEADHGEKAEDDS